MSLKQFCKKAIVLNINVNYFKPIAKPGVYKIKANKIGITAEIAEYGIKFENN